MSLTIAEMQLAQNAKRAAQMVLDMHPGIIFTSGRRDLRGQARAMAENTIRHGVGWLNSTYKNKEMVGQLEEWMEANLEKTASTQHMTEGFYQTLVSLQAGRLAQFPHCRGDAFDIQCPRFADGRIDEASVNAIKRTIEALPVELGLQLILTHEGSLRIVHAQFAHAVEAVQI